MHTPHGHWTLLLAAPSVEVDRAAEQELVEALRARQGRATLGDLVRDTGLPRARAETTVRAMLGLYRSHLAVDENGELLYLFHPSMERRVRASDGWQRFMKTLRGAFVFGFKLTTMLILVGYVVVFCLLIIAAVVAMVALLEDVPDVVDVGEGEGCFGALFESLWFWDVGYVMYVPMMDIYAPGVGFGRDDSARAHGWRPLTLRTPGALDARYVGDTYRTERSRKHHFYEDVFSFVFGPQVPEPPPLANERELLAFIEENQGIITRTELISRTGVSVEEAEEELARLLARYEGDVEVTEAGELLYTFHELRVTAGNEGRKSQPAPPAWHRFEGDRPLTGNSMGVNMAIGGMALFTMAMSVIAPVALFPILNLGALAAIPLSAIPLVVSLLYFAIPFVRSFAVRAENRKRRARNIRRGALLVIFRHLARPEGTPLRKKELPAQVRELLSRLRALPSADNNAQRDVDEALGVIRDAEIIPVLEELLTELEAEKEVDEGGDTLLTFPRQRSELRAADLARQVRGNLDVRIGDIVYSSADEDDAPLQDQLAELEPEAPRAFNPEQSEDASLFSDFDAQLQAVGGSPQRATQEAAAEEAEEVVVEEEAVTRQK
ncbi:MAG: hypothetical protein CMH57_11880 [Myxococcales bacterium]|nr:hypothetical protein [Myxococcales bacterium]